MSAVKSRLQAILETDWKSEAAELLAQRKVTGEGPVCILKKNSFIDLIMLRAAFYAIVHLWAHSFNILYNG
jgi:hypothetical protein